MNRKDRAKIAACIGRPLKDFDKIEPISGMPGERWECGREEYLVYSDLRADMAFREAVIDSLWAFRPSFLADTTGLPLKAFEALKPLNEDAQAPIEAMVRATCGIDRLVELAEQADGRGHALSSWDGRELAAQCEKKTYYAYRVS
jgi:hypothetical protein